MTSPLNPSIGPQDLSHAILVAILMAQGGSVTLPPGSFEPDALGGFDGSWHAVAMEPQPDGTVRISVRPRPDVNEAGITLH
nr:pRL2-19 [Streptomyces chartreusis]